MCYAEESRIKDGDQPSAVPSQAAWSCLAHERWRSPCFCDRPASSFLLAWAESQKVCCGTASGPQRVSSSSGSGKLQAWLQGTDDPLVIRRRVPKISASEWCPLWLLLCAAKSPLCNACETSWPLSPLRVEMRVRSASSLSTVPSVCRACKLCRRRGHHSCWLKEGRIWGILIAERCRSSGRPTTGQWREDATGKWS